MIHPKEINWKKIAIPPLFLPGPTEGIYSDGICVHNWNKNNFEQNESTSRKKSLSIKKKTTIERLHKIEQKMTFSAKQLNNTILH